MKHDCQEQTSDIHPHYLLFQTVRESFKYPFFVFPKYISTICRIKDYIILKSQMKIKKTALIDYLEYLNEYNQ